MLWNFDTNCYKVSVAGIQLNDKTNLNLKCQDDMNKATNTKF